MKQSFGLRAIHFCDANKFTFVAKKKKKYQQKNFQAKHLKLRPIGSKSLNLATQKIRHDEVKTTKEVCFKGKKL